MRIKKLLLENFGPFRRYDIPFSDKYTMVITKDGESLIRKPIKELANELDPNKFWRIHRGTIGVRHIRKRYSYKSSYMKLLATKI